MNIHTQTHIAIMANFDTDMIELSAQLLVRKLIKIEKSQQ
jgi:hypothetical protein